MSEAILLNHYKIDSLDLIRWPAEKDVEDSSDEEETVLSPRLPSINSRRSKSRFSALGRNSSSRSSIPGAERTRDGRENLVQKDEPDPLGGVGSVVQILRQKGTRVEEDAKFRNRFLLSSTTFSPSLFLSEVHSTASTEQLLQGLDFLSRSIEKKSASLKILVESNFERFVRAKATIDNVYTEMRNQGSGPDMDTSKGRTHSRHTSRGATHMRRLSGIVNNPNSAAASTTLDKRKNALLKENEYGVQPIKGPLLELNVKAKEVWGPALGGKDKEDNFKAVLNCMDRSRGVFEVGRLIEDCISKRDYRNLATEYAKAKQYANDARNIADGAQQTGAHLSDTEIHQIVAIARMWSDVERQVSNVKRELWQRLAGTNFTKSGSTPNDDRSEEYLELIAALIDLDVEDNPISTWLFSRYDYMKNKVHAALERSKVEIEVSRRRLASGEKPPARQLAMHVQNLEIDGRIKQGSPDAPRIIEVWEHVYAVLNYLLDHQVGVLGELVEFWEIVQGFKDGKAQKGFPSAVDQAKRQQHRLSADSLSTLTTGVADMLFALREGVTSLFCDPPVEDLSALLTPVLTAPPTPQTPASSTLSPMLSSQSRFDASSLPPVSPKLGEYWEKFAFWPPHSNSLSGVHYLSKLLKLIGTAVGDMAALSLTRDNRSHDQLKTFIGNIRERCVQAACAAWAADADNAKILEEWTRQAERPDLTNLPPRIMTFEGFLLSNLQRILFVDESKRQSNRAEVVVPPSQKLLQIVRTQFSGSVYKILNGMVDNAENPIVDEDQLGEEVVDLSMSLQGIKMGENSSNTVDLANKNVRILLTLSNIQSVRNEIVPHLITQFETSFAQKLTEETTKIRDVLGQIDARLFQSYVTPVSTKLDNIIKEGITSATWVPETHRPTDAKPYVYEVLLELVHVHTELSTTAAPLTSPVLKYLLEQLSTSLINAFKLRPRYTLAALMQATLDVEFLAQTLNNYTTDRASETQSAIYIALDERTDNEARVKLQEELQEMRAILKRLREGTRVEFACFKRQRSHTKSAASERPSSRGKDTTARAGAGSRTGASSRNG